MNQKPTISVRFRLMCSSAVILCCAALLFHKLKFSFPPSPIGDIQVVFVVIIMVLFLLAAIHNPGRIWRILYGVKIAVLALGGAALSFYQLWLQSLPGHLQTCTVSLWYLLHSFPLQTVVRAIVNDSGSCLNMQWHWLFFNIIQWRITFFFLMAIMALFLLRKR